MDELEALDDNRWWFAVVRVANGYVWFTNTTGGECETEYVIEAPDEDTDEADQVAFVRLVDRMAEHFGFTYDKFSRTNLRVVFDLVGHKCEDAEDE